jgi:hypothetical protein
MICNCELLVGLTSSLAHRIVHCYPELQFSAFANLLPQLPTKWSIVPSLNHPTNIQSSSKYKLVFLKYSLRC